MRKTLREARIEVFSTCPQSSAAVDGSYLRNVVDVARWSEQAGCTGILVYTDNSQVDPWLVSHLIIQNTASLCPLVAVQPIYLHPYAVAKMVATLGSLYGRRVYLNMVAGGFKNDLTALNDTTPHDKRYQRLVEYTTIISRLLSGASPVSYQGEFYRVENLKLSPPLPQELFPGIFVSGSSEEGLAAAAAIGATAIKYPKPAHEEYQGDRPDRPGENGIRVGIIARELITEAWAVAHARFPEDRKGQLAHQLAMRVSDSVWHKQLSQMEPETEKSPYWLVPFQNYKTMCPYLVGSYDCVAEELARYIAAGYRTFILDIPPNVEELNHISHAFNRALEL
ncbi:MAG: LLM class flavin-dependent oxidoreductase [Nitrospirae bacterium]|nr:MAG: LLM class flavin-dependent oxidoreductase [Nitrospirota bacterium]